MQPAGTLHLTRQDPFWTSALQSSKILRFVLNLWHLVIAATGIQYPVITGSLKGSSFALKLPLKVEVHFTQGLG